MAVMARNTVLLLVLVATAVQLCSVVPPAAAAPADGGDGVTGLPDDLTGPVIGGIVGGGVTGVPGDLIGPVGGVTGLPGDLTGPVGGITGGVH
ncbi:hypothetical protein SEVIR_8G156201v4 [Setaria viridis]|uniref:Uncharacterized protein n=1 Tax=Setaria viridis TaxID=4556 RepID=A0A4U6TIY2_SETVI|nr:hypothetical protein SEVIR_8G156201v2 [Setaria viridis]